MRLSSWRSNRTPGPAAALAIALTLSLTGSPCFCAEHETEAPNSQVAEPWPLERVTLRDGRVYRGLVRSEAPQTLDFLQVERPAGAPLYLVGLDLRRTDIAEIVRLPAEQQQQLRERLAKHVHRARIEAEDLANVRLDRANWQRQPAFEVRDPDFAMTSTADELTTRQAVVRLRQYFAGFAQLLPNAPATTPVHIYLHGTIAAQRRQLDALGLPLDRVAVYLPARREIIAAADLNHLTAALAATRAEHEQILRQYDALVAELPERLRAESQRLREQGASGSQLRQLNLLARRQVEEEVDRVRRTVNDYERRNAAAFDEAAAGLFAVLAHEATHAWLDAHWPQADGGLPRWLHEGLAQVFETARLEAGQLRIDAPDPRRLALLQEELRGKAPLPLADVLQADDPTWLSAHEARDVARRQYLYAWGVAWYLAVESGACTAERLDALQSEIAKHQSPTVAFAAVGGRPLSAFEPQWREAMLALTSTPVATPPATRTVPRTR